MPSLLDMIRGDVNQPQQQTPQERSQAGYGDIDWLTEMGASEWNPVARYGYTGSTGAGSIPQAMEDSALGATAGDPNVLSNIKRYNTQPRNPITRAIRKYQNVQPELLKQAYPVFLDTKLQYLEDLPLIQHVLREKGKFPEKAIPQNMSEFRELKRKVLEHEYTHRGLSMMGASKVFPPRDPNKADPEEVLVNRIMMERGMPMDEHKYNRAIGTQGTTIDTARDMFNSRAKMRLQDLGRWYPSPMGVK